MINIMLAEDHKIVRDGLKFILEKEPEFNIVAEVNNGKEVIEAFNKSIQVDILLSDMNMPVMGGQELTQWIKANQPQVQVIILTALDIEEYVIKTFKAGACGYLLKNISADELHFAIRHVHAKNQYVCSELTMRFVNRLVTMPDHTSTEMQAGLEFSSRELEILTLLADGFTNQEIADKLFTSKRTVEGHRQNLIDKTGVRNTAALIRFAVLNGIIH
jgi:DNA-binding NarL/FixJ family response regulator